MRMDIGDIERKKAFIEEFQRKAEQSMKIRIWIAKKKTKAIWILVKNIEDVSAGKDWDKGIRILTISLNHDKKLLKIIEYGLSKSEAELIEITDWLIANVKDREVRRNAVMLVKLIKLFHNNISKIKKIIEKEEKFTNTRTKKSFKDFIKEWKKEIKINQKFLKKVAGLSRLNEYFEKAKTLFKQAKLGYTAGTVGPGALAFLYKAASGEDADERMALVLGMTVFVCVLSNTLLMMAYLEKEIEEINLRELGMVS